MNESAANSNGQTATASARLSGVAVVGLGYWGPNWVRNLQACGLCDRVVACDLNPARRRYVQDLYPAVRACDRVETVLDDPTVQAVIIATPVRTHWELARRFLAAGKSVLVEKPLASSSKQCAELIEMAAARGLVLMVGHTFLYSASVAKLCEIVNSGELGDLLPQFNPHQSGSDSAGHQRRVGPGAA
jgi:predicted dehydrogenase